MSEVMFSESYQSYVASAWVDAGRHAEAVQREKLRPFYLLNPRVFPDGDKWCALYGNNIQEGVCGFGDTPEKASIQFDVEWMNARCPGIRNPKLNDRNSETTP